MDPPPPPSGGSSRPQPQRVVFLIDLHPLFLGQNPNPNSNPVNYISHISASVRKLLTFSSSSLFAFKLFISSLSPILSDSNLQRLFGRSPPPFSFRRPAEALSSLSQFLLHFPNPQVGPAALPPPRASLLTKFLLQLEHDYSWDPLPPIFEAGNSETPTFPPNLVLLFSPVHVDYFLDLDEMTKSLDFDGFYKEFCRILVPVNDKFAPRGIHFSWIGVNHDGRSKSGFLERGIRDLGWGFCSTDAIVVGSALVPFGLIFPYIGCKMGFNYDKCVAKGQAELLLRITDVSGKPLECKSCQLEVIGQKLAGVGLEVWPPFSKDSDGGSVKIRIKEVWRRSEETEFIESSAGLVLLRGILDESKNARMGDCRKVSNVDRVLELLCIEKGDLTMEKPIWQLLMAFLFRRNYWASVSITHSDGNSFEGILKPFAVNYALLSITEKSISNSCQSSGNDLPNRFPSTTTADSPNAEDGRRKGNKTHKHLMQDVTWSSFYEAAFRLDDDCPVGMDLEEVYFTAESSKSKKLRFLKCWMKQMKKLGEIRPNEQKTLPIVNEESQQSLGRAGQELHLCASMSPVPGTHHSEPIDKEKSSLPCLEDFEAFLETIPQKIEQGTSSKEVDLWNLAERLVLQSLDALYAKFRSKRAGGSVCEETEIDSEVYISSEIYNLLLMKPKDIMLKYKGSSSASHPDQCAATYCTENIIREHELQILLRMELLQSKIAASLEENAKPKMVKEICSLLQNIEFYLQGDFLNGESLLDFAGRTIKSRYAHSLGDVIHKIYNEMEFFSFDDDEMEASDSLAGNNSEERNTDGNESNNSGSNAFEPTTRASSSQSTAHLQEGNAKGFAEDNIQDPRLMKAQKRRDRARRFSSFTSWVPDLRRLWALKQARLDRPPHEYFPNSKSKRMKRERKQNEVVCETPMSGRKHLRMQEDENTGSDTRWSNGSPCKSLSKALFQHE